MKGSSIKASLWTALPHQLKSDSSQAYTDRQSGFGFTGRDVEVKGNHLWPSLFPINPASISRLKVKVGLITPVVSVSPVRWLSHSLLQLEGTAGWRSLLPPARARSCCSCPAADAWSNSNLLQGCWTMSSRSWGCSGGGRVYSWVIEK